MRAFLKMTGISMQGQLYYKTSFLLNLLTPLILLVGQYLLWNGLYAQQGGELIGGMSQKTMYTYILIAFALNNLLSWSSENTLAREIRTGTVVTRCIRPVSFLSQAISGMFGGVILQGTVNVFIVILGLVCLRDYMLSIAWKNVWLFLPCVLLAVVIRMMMIEIFSLICFFFYGTSGNRMDKTGSDRLFFRGADTSCDVSALFTEDDLSDTVSLYDTGSDCGTAGAGASVLYGSHLYDTNGMDWNLLATALCYVWSHSQEYEYCRRVSYDKNFSEDEGAIY